LLADCSKACRGLDWVPKKQFKNLVMIMVDADLETVGVASPGDGKKILESRIDSRYQWKGNPIELMQEDKRGGIACNNS